MKYVYGLLGRDFDITILATSTHEDAAITQDVASMGGKLILHNTGGSERKPLWSAVFRELRNGRYDVIQSQGFISGVHSYLANIPFRIPHILTVHGILERKYLAGPAGALKGRLIAHVLRNVDVVHCVGKDIQTHLEERATGFVGSRSRKVVIPNGIDTEEIKFFESGPDIRAELGIGRETFVVGFIGRFMQQKGFEYLIDAMDLLRGDGFSGGAVKVVAIGSGDYIREYQAAVKGRNLEDLFIFAPFRPFVWRIFPSFDVVAMPSIWEACPILAMEVLCTGTPLIASNCIGLRETVAGTPAIVFPTQSAVGLAGAIRGAIAHPPRRTFQDFVPTACRMYDVGVSANSLGELIQDVCGAKASR